MNMEGNLEVVVEGSGAPGARHPVGAGLEDPRRLLLDVFRVPGCRAQGTAGCWISGGGR